MGGVVSGDGTFFRKSVFKGGDGRSFVVGRQVGAAYRHSNALVAHEFLHGAEIHPSHN